MRIFLFIMINVALAWLCKKSFGLKLFERWPDYHQPWKRWLASFAPALLLSLSFLLTYLLFLLWG